MNCQFRHATSFVFCSDDALSPMGFEIEELCCDDVKVLPSKRKQNNGDTLSGGCVFHICAKWNFPIQPCQKLSHASIHQQAGIQGTVDMYSFYLERVDFLKGHLSDIHQTKGETARLFLSI